MIKLWKPPLKNILLPAMAGARLLARVLRIGCLVQAMGLLVVAVACGTAAGAAAAGAASVTRAQDGAEMVLVPAGEFIYGDDKGRPEERPQQKVTVKSFYIDRYEVSNAQYRRFLDWVHLHSDKTVAHVDQPANKDHTPRYFKPFRPALLKQTGIAQLQPFDDSTFSKDDCPVVGVDWWDAYAYARWAGKRLPDEVEWEKAARGKDGRNWPWGNVFDFKFCNSGGYEPKGREAADKGMSRFVYAAPVKSFPAGASVFGCINMAGNVAEWVNDLYVPGHKKMDHFQKTRPEDSVATVERVVKGGGSDSYPSSVRPAARRGFEPEFRYFSIGFRCAQDAPARKAGVKK
jgi:formylglycine-generating enzyme